MILRGLRFCTATRTKTFSMGLHEMDRQLDVTRHHYLDRFRGPGQTAIDDPVLHQRMAHEAQAAELVVSLANKLRMRIGCRGVGRVRALLLWDVTLAIASGGGRPTRTVPRHEILALPRNANRSVLQDMANHIATSNPTGCSADC